MVFHRSLSDKSPQVSKTLLSILAILNNAVIHNFSQSPQFCKFSFFLLITIRSGLLVKIRRSVCMTKSHRSLYVSFSRTDAGFCIYHLFVWSNLNFLHISQWITLPTKLCLVFFFFFFFFLLLLLLLVVVVVVDRKLLETV